MELKELVGKHIFSGADFGKETGKDWMDMDEDYEVFRFVLDGVTYKAREDPSDGYRSNMRDLGVSTDPITNTFEGVEVVGILRTKGELWSGEVDDVLVLVDVNNGKTVLEVGTRNTDDYYPMWVAKFIPENLSLNEGR